MNLINIRELLNSTWSRSARRYKFVILLKNSYWINTSSLLNRTKWLLLHVYYIRPKICSKDTFNEFKHDSYVPNDMFNAIDQDLKNLNTHSLTVINITATKLEDTNQLKYLFVHYNKNMVSAQNKIKQKSILSDARARDHESNTIK